eukprot:scpid43479/ scgid16899/ 
MVDPYDVIVMSSPQSRDHVFPMMCIRGSAQCISLNYVPSYQYCCRTAAAVLGDSLHSMWPHACTILVVACASLGLKSRSCHREWILCVQEPPHSSKLSDTNWRSLLSARIE